MLAALMSSVAASAPAAAQYYYPARPFVGAPGRDFPMPPPPPPTLYPFTGRTPVRSAPRPPPIPPGYVERDVPRPDAETHMIEGEVLAFCDAHLDEPFCTHLLGYLRKHRR
jgi:hypothetical protein